MRKSMAVKLVLLNSVLAMAGCSRTTCAIDEKKDKEEPGAKGQTSCRGRTYGHGGSHVYYWGGGRIGGATRPGTTTNVGRGGFGSTGHATS